MEDRWSINFDKDPDSLFTSLIACIVTKIKNWRIIKGDQTGRKLLLVPVGDMVSQLPVKIIGSEIEVRIVHVDKKASRLIVILRRSQDVLKDESRETIAREYPVNLLLSLGETDEMNFDLQTVGDALSKHGGPIAKTVTWHLNNRGFFKEIHGQQERLAVELRELFGPPGELIIQDIMDQMRNKPKESKDGEQK